MKWLYLDFDTLENAAIANGFKIQKIETTRRFLFGSTYVKVRFILHSKVEN